MRAKRIQSTTLCHRRQAANVQLIATEVNVTASVMARDVNAHTKRLIVTELNQTDIV